MVNQLKQKTISLMLAAETRFLLTINGTIIIRPRGIAWNSRDTDV